MVRDPEDDDGYIETRGGACKWKYCAKNDNREAGGSNPVIDYTEDTFYACKFDSCHYSVHEECYGGVEKNRDL